VLVPHSGPNLVMWKEFICCIPTKSLGLECHGDHAKTGHAPPKMPNTQRYARHPRGMDKASGEVGQQDYME
jgi:hypothetical protein